MMTAAVIAPKARTEKNERTDRIMAWTLREAEQISEASAVSKVAS
jgi:hypothetical protein